MQTFKTPAREASQHSVVVGTKTNNSETLGNHRVANEVGSGHMAFGIHPVGCKDPPENFNQESHEPSDSWERLAGWQSKADLTEGVRWHRTQYQKRWEGGHHIVKRHFQGTGNRIS